MTTKTKTLPRTPRPDPTRQPCSDSMPSETDDPPAEGLTDLPAGGPPSEPRNVPEGPPGYCVKTQVNKSGLGPEGPPGMALKSGRPIPPVSTKRGPGRPRKILPL